MIVEGVLAGNQGPIFYAGQEIARSATGWNHRPITVGHPQVSGNHVSGCTPEAIEEFGVGILLNTSWNSKNKKLRADAYFEETRLDVVPGGSRIKDALNSGKPVEVSTGLFVDNEMASGDWSGKKFSAKARNLRPDHLAILLDIEGACSLKDGAGLLVNKTVAVENFTSEAVDGKLLENLIEEVRDSKIKPPVTNTKVEMDRETLLKALGDDHKEFVTNMSDAQVEALSALEIKVEVEKEIIKEVQVANQVNTLDEALALAPVADQVIVKEALAVNADYRKGLVDKILANEHNQFSVEELSAMPSATLQKLSAFAVNAAQAPKQKNPVYAGSAASAEPTVVKGFVSPSTFVPQGE